VRAREKSSISTYRKSTTRFPTSHRWTVYITLSPPKGGTKRDIAIFQVNFNFQRKKPAAKFLCAKTSSSRVVATPFLHLTVHRWITGDVSIYQKICAQSDLPLQKTNVDFDRFRLIVAQPWELARTAIIANRKSTTRFPSSHRWTLCVTPRSPKGWLKTRIFTCGVVFHFFVAGHSSISNLVCGLNIASPSLQMTNCPWKGHGYCHVTSLVFGK